jgi:hypothetical protein
VTKSARESSSLPIGELTFSIRAENPSRKSSKSAAQMRYAPLISLPCKTRNIPRQPHSRLQQVKKFGICFLIFN